MKIFNEKDYAFMGTVDNLYAFLMPRKGRLDPELVLVPRAKFIKKDGTVVYYDPISSNQQNSDKRKIHIGSISYSLRKEVGLTTDK